MTDHIEPTVAAVTAEPMINARQASYALHLPYYWFADPHMRAVKGIPYYQLSRLVRFRLSELLVWQRRHDSQQNDLSGAEGDSA
jgi:hypothetical protein